jgi:hypothetical protein
MTLSPAVANRSVTRRRAPIITDPRYGDELADWANATTLVITGCALQPGPATEFTDPTRRAVTTGWALFAPPGTDLAAGDRVEVDGLTFEVDGEPADWAAPGGRADHVAATLIRVEG